MITLAFRLLIVVATFFLLSGCSTKYTCGAFPDSGCQPVSSVYESTNDGMDDYRANLFIEKSGTERKSRADVEKLRGDTSSAVAVAQAHQSINYISPGDPLLTEPVILRIYFSSWQDKDLDLNVGGFVYLRLKEPEWVIK